MADATIDLMKTSFEQFAIDIDFTDRFPAGASNISTATFSALGYAWPSGTKADASATFLASTDGTVVDLVKARATILNGTDGYAYDVICKATLDDGSKVEHAITVRVEDNV